MPMHAEKLQWKSLQDKQKIQVVLASFSSEVQSLLWMVQGVLAETGLKLSLTVCVPD